MKINHIAIWTRNLECLKQFYGDFFDGEARTKFHNPKTGLKTYFLTFTSGAQLEIIQKPYVISKEGSFANLEIGYIHIAFSVGSKDKVNQLTERIKENGYSIINEPRLNGDGYYESVILDPDGNRVEIAE